MRVRRCEGAGEGAGERGGEGAGEREREREREGEGEGGHLVCEVRSQGKSRGNVRGKLAAYEVERRQGTHALAAHQFVCCWAAVSHHLLTVWGRAHTGNGMSRHVGDASRRRGNRLG